MKDSTSEKDSNSRKVQDLSGIWECSLDDETGYVYLPGTLDENLIGKSDDIAQAWHPDAELGDNSGCLDGVILSRLTRRFRYEGQAAFCKRIMTEQMSDIRRFVYVERSRMLTLEINGEKITPFIPGTLSTPWEFDVTEQLTGDDLLTLICDNSYEGLPGDAIRYSSAATDETQTNWNGLLGKIELVERPASFVYRVNVFPGQDNIRADIILSSTAGWQGSIRIESAVLQEPAILNARVGTGITVIHTDILPLRRDAPRWELGKGRLVKLCVSPDGLESYTVNFGIRLFTAADGYLRLNHQPVFLRGETNCAVFPETGYPPLDVDSWLDILSRYMAYGVNCVRFHSHIPPEAAFLAADKLGLLLQPELSHWDPRDAFGSSKSRRYYRVELEQALSYLANHPSFVMLSLGNELHYSDESRPFVEELLVLARSIDSTRLYTGGSNAFYGEKGCDSFSDFETFGMICGKDLRGTHSGMIGFLNRSYAHAWDYRECIEQVRIKSKHPMISFEAGQYESLPDFEQLKAFNGVTNPANLLAMQERAEHSGMMEDWDKRVEASGELALICYRAEVEAALLTEGLSGIFLLGLQDFPGQGTALVGMMDSHLRPKPYAFAEPVRFRAFFRDCLPIPFLPKRTYYSDEPLRAEIHFVNHSGEDIAACLMVELDGVRRTFPQVLAHTGKITDIGQAEFDLSAYHQPSMLSLRVVFGEHTSSTRIWVYQRIKPCCPSVVYETRQLDAAALQILEQGGRVYLAPDSNPENLPCSVQEYFSTDFWSVGTFPKQTGGMGLLIDRDHPIFTSFPTESHTDWQWWPMAGRRAVVLPLNIPTIVTQLDCAHRMRHLAMLFEGRCLKGRILMSSMGLHEIYQYPEACALQNAIYRYMQSDLFDPKTVLAPEMLQSITAAGVEDSGK